MNRSFAPGVSHNSSKAMINLLNARLADAIDVRLAIKQAHWNIKGPNFIALHELFDDVSGHFDDHVDTIAERVVQLGGQAMGTTQAVASTTKMPQYPVEATDQADHIKALTEMIGSFAKSVRAAIDEADNASDADTADIFTQVSRAVDKDLWFIGSHEA